MKPRCVIGLTGGSGSGKTSLLHGLRDQFEDSQVAFLCQDNYYRLREKQGTDAEGVKNFDLPKSFHMREFARDLACLRKGETVTRTEYTYNNSDAEASEIVVRPAPLLIVEGLFIMHKETIRSQLDMSVYVEVEDVLKFKRRILRDRIERNYPLEAVLYRYEHHVLPAYRKYIEPYRSEVTLIVNNNRDMTVAIALLSSYMREVIKQG